MRRYRFWSQYSGVRYSILFEQVVISIEIIIIEII